MPGAPNKIIINNILSTGDRMAQRCAYEGATHIAEAIERHDPNFSDPTSAPALQIKGLMREAHQIFSPRLEAHCASRRALMRQSTEELEAIVTEMRNWLDKKLGLC